MENLLATATIGATHGLDGELRVYPNNPEASNLSKLKSVTLQDRLGTCVQVDVESYRVVGGQPMMRFKGYETPEKAKMLTRRLVMVPREKACPLKKGQVYLADLIGCRLCHDGEELATVVSAFEGPQALLLECKTLDGKTHLVPLLDQYVGTIDVEDKAIDLIAEWILQ